MGLLPRSQIGSGMLYHRGNRLQSGGSLGGLLGRLFAKALPLAAKVGKASLSGARKFGQSQLAKQLKETAVNAASDAAIDILTGSKSAADAVQSGLETGLSDAKKSVADAIKSSRDKAVKKKKTLKRKKVSHSINKGKKKSKPYNLLEESP